jgi:hypothetical protein
MTIETELEQKKAALAKSEAGLSETLDKLRARLDPKTLLLRILNGLQRFFQHERNLLIVVSSMLGIWILYSLFSSDEEPKALPVAGAAGAIVVERRPSWLGRWVGRGLRLIALQLLRRLLQELLSTRIPSALGEKRETE